MAREKPTYRDELEQILARFGKHIFSWKEVQVYTGRGKDWCNTHLKIPHDGCTAVQLAHALTNLGGKRNGYS